MILGIDEVGTGSLIGDAYVCGVSLLDTHQHFLEKLKDDKIINDSKKMSSKQKEIAIEYISKLESEKTISVLLQKSYS